MSTNLTIEVHPTLPRTTVNEEVIVCGGWGSGLPCWKRDEEIYRCSACRMIELMIALDEQIHATAR